MWTIEDLLLGFLPNRAAKKTVKCPECLGTGCYIINPEIDPIFEVLTCPKCKGKGAIQYA